MATLPTIYCETPVNGGEYACLGQMTLQGRGEDLFDVARSVGWEVPEKSRSPFYADLGMPRPNVGPTRCPACVAGNGPLRGYRCPFCGAYDAGDLICTKCGHEQAALHTD